MRVRTSGAEYALPVERVSEVRSASGLTPLPEPREGVAGLMTRGGETITVLSVLCADGRHVVLVDAGDVTFGLLVDEVTGVHQVDDAAIGPSPAGQLRPMVEGVLTGEDAVVLLLDVAALARWLSA